VQTPEGEHVRDLAPDPSATLAAVRRAADEWGAEFSPGDPAGRLRLPVTFGLRRGFQSGHLAILPCATGSRLSFRVVTTETHLQPAAVGFLALGALGGITLMLWPFFPGLLRLAPIGAVLAFGAWFLVIARLHVSGPREFLERVAELAAAPPEEPEPVELE
jgi:hypothetical protein